LWNYLLFYINRLTKAKNYLDESISKATIKNMHREKLHIYQKKYTHLYDSLFNANCSKFILEYKEKFQAKQKETENKLLRTQQLIIQSKFKQRNQMLYIKFLPTPEGPVIRTSSFLLTKLRWASCMISVLSKFRFLVKSSSAILAY